MKQEARNNAIKNYDWNAVLQTLMETNEQADQKMSVHPKTLAYAT
jgi:hypothetical protein